MAKVRKQIYIEEEHDLQLKRYKKEAGMSEAELIRNALEFYFDSFHKIRGNLNPAQGERQLSHLKQER